MIELLVVGVTIVAAAGVKGAEAHQRSLATRTLERYARVRGHAFVPESHASGRRSPRVEGTKDGLRFAIDFCRIRGRLSTRVAAVVVRAPGPRFALVQRSRIARVLGVEEEGAVGLRETEVDDAYRIRGTGPADARALLEPHHRLLAALDRRTHVWLACDGAEASVTWAGVETDPIVVDAARDVVLAAAQWHRPDAPYR